MNLSAYMSSVRPNRWLSLYNRLKDTGLDFELVIVGSERPTQVLPSEIKYHYSRVKPAQCFHAAGELCTGEAMLQIVDDCVYDKGTIETMFKVVTENTHLMATASYCQYGHNETRTDAPPEFRVRVLEQNIAGVFTMELPLLPVCGMFSRYAWTTHQGLDKRFDGIMGELDLYMRLSIAGYQTCFVPGRVVEHDNFEKKGGLMQQYWAKDRSQFIRLWNMNGGESFHRLDVMRPYTKEDLLTVNQFYDY